MLSEAAINGIRAAGDNPSLRRHRAAVNRAGSKGQNGLEKMDGYFMRHPSARSPSGLRAVALEMSAVSSRCVIFGKISQRAIFLRQHIAHDNAGMLLRRLQPRALVMDDRMNVFRVAEDLRRRGAAHAQAGGQKRKANQAD